MNHPSRILIVEDNPNLQEVMRKILDGEGYSAAAAATGRAAMETIRKDGPFDLILLDIMLPDPDTPSGAGIDGLEVCRRVKKDPALQDTLIFLVTVKDQPEDIMRGIDAGADDYITKPFNTTLLLAKIKAMLRIKLLQGELREKNRLLEEMAITDGLTRIPNHRFLMEKLDEEMRRSRRYGTSFVLILLDLDNFKEINDTFGHRHGDHVLKKVASFIRQGLRETDILARYGGDEFAVLLPQTDRRGGAKVAREILERISQPFLHEGHPHSVKASVGLIAIPQTQAENIDDLIIMVDSALYRAKQLGGNRVFDPLET